MGRQCCGDAWLCVQRMCGGSRSRDEHLLIYNAWRRCLMMTSVFARWRVLYYARQHAVQAPSLPVCLRCVMILSILVLQSLSRSLQSPSQPIRSTSLFIVTFALLHPRRNVANHWSFVRSADVLHLVSGINCRSSLSVSDSPLHTPVTISSSAGSSLPLSTKIRPHRQQCRSNVRLCRKNRSTWL